MRLRRVLVLLASLPLVLAACSSGTSGEADGVNAGSTSASGPTTSTTSSDGPGPLEEITIDVGEFTFDAIAQGPDDGEVVFLLHGFPQTNLQWSNQIEALAGAGYRVIAPNQRGYSAGARPPEVDDYAMVDLIADVIGMADALGVEQFNLGGHDWGAAVAWAVAATNPDRVASLMAVSVPHPAAYSEALEDPAGDQSSKVGYIEVFSAEGAEAQFLDNDAAFLRGIYRDAGLDDAEMEPYLDVLANEEALGAALNWYRANDLAGGTALPAVSVPTLYVWSDGDCCLGRDSAELTEKYVEAPYEFVIFEGVNHWVPEQAADELSAEMLDFLGSL